jgi:hypothetical protein
VNWVVKTSSVRVSDHDGDRVYRSLDDVPNELRTKIRECIEGPNAETILIANQEAYDRISRGVTDLPAALQKFRPERKPQPQDEPVIDGRMRALILGGLGLIFLLWAIWLWSIRSGMS